MSILANKLDSLLLVLHKTLKNLGQNDVKNNKLLLENFEFYRKEILSKDAYIKDLMETQTTVLDVVTSVKKKTQKKTQKANVPEQQQQQYLQIPHIQQHVLREHNICQDQQQFELEIFQSKVRPQNRKKCCN